MKKTEFEDYWIDEMGNVYSTKKRRGLTKLKPYKNNKGYCRISIKTESGYKNIFVHRLVGKAFIPNPENYPCLNHKNSVRDDNRVDNLEWCTQSQNMKHSYDEGGRKPPLTALAKSWEKKRRKVIQMDKNGNKKKEWGSIIDASNHYKTNHSTIVDCCMGRQKTARGFRWCYKEDYQAKHKEPLIYRDSSKPIRQINSQNEIVKIWRSATEAAKKLKGSQANITACCLGTRNISLGYKWEYENGYLKGEKND
jgi:hypothetical protein